jgi:pSer/pThr/pTyr-binding forkhead associated (FHA) protein
MGPDPLPSPRYKVTCGGRDVWLPGGRYTVGRSELCSIAIEDARASRYHACLVVTAGVLTVADAGSANGTFVNGTRLGAEPATLAAGDRVVVGSREFVVGLGVPPGQSRVSRRPADSGRLSDLSPSTRELATSSGPATESVDALRLLGEVADSALRAGNVEDAARMLGPQVERVVEELRAGRGVSPHLAWGVDQALRLAATTRVDRWLGLALELVTADPGLLATDARVAALERAAEALGAGAAARIDVWLTSRRSELPAGTVALMMRVLRMAERGQGPGDETA